MIQFMKVCRAGYNFGILAPGAENTAGMFWTEFRWFLLWASNGWLAERVCLFYLSNYTEKEFATYFHGEAIVGLA